MIRKTLLAAAIAGFALHAQAATVAVNFSSDGFDDGSLFGETLSGQFSYDDATLTSSTDWLALSSFSFTLAGQTYTLAGAELDAAAATFTAGLISGVDAVMAAAGGRDFAFVSGFGSPYVYYESNASTALDFGFANLSFSTAAATVPEPASYALVLAALGGGLLARRRKA